MAVHRIYFDPGMFGFGRLASYEYFGHLRKALERELTSGGDTVECYVADVQPTASIRRRAGRLAELIAQTCDADDPHAGPIHLVGHSTGGLDARLVASPSVSLPVPPGTMRWIPRLVSVSTLSTPHYGTPLAGFFATVSGQRMLYALSALTFIALSLGSPPLAAASALVVALGRLDRALGIELKVLDRATDALLKVLGDARSGEVRSYLSAIKDDQAALIQLTPEAMDLFQAGIEDRPGVVYQSTASMAPPPTPIGWAKTLVRPWVTVSHSIFTALYAVTARLDERYPCAAHHAGLENEATLERVFGRAPGARANDGVVPLRSQIWGKVVWAGHADHLDILGHFRGGADSPANNDWLSSGSSFDAASFDALTRALGAGMRAAAQAAAAEAKRSAAPPVP
jgi:triacylglycerol lipase